MTDSESEMRRMLLWFKSNLPSHDVSVWRIVSQPVPIATLIEDSTDSRVHYANNKFDKWRVIGFGQCARCRKQFPVPSIGNACTINQERIPAVVEEMKAWVRRDAFKEDPCWGDIPPLDDDSGLVAVMDDALQDGP